jgi:hypothetical protein
MDGLLLTRHRLSREVARLSALLADRGLDAQDLTGQLDKLGEGQALMWGLTGQLGQAPVKLKFSLGPQIFPQMQRLYRYLEEKVAPPQQFYFHESQVPPAGNLSDLIARIRIVDLTVIEFHFERGDLSHWVRDVLHDETLARWLDRLQVADLSGEALRLALLDTLEQRHRVLERLF